MNDRDYSTGPYTKEIGTAFAKVIINFYLTPVNIVITALQWIVGILDVFFARGRNNGSFYSMCIVGVCVGALLIFTHQGFLALAVAVGVLGIIAGFIAASWALLSDWLAECKAKLEKEKLIADALRICASAIPSVPTYI